MRGVVLLLQVNKTMKGAIVVLGLLRHGCAIWGHPLEPASLPSVQLVTRWKSPKRSEEGITWDRRWYKDRGSAMEALWNLANDYHLTNGDFHKLRRLSFLSQTIIKRTFPCPFSHEMFCPLKFSFVRNRKQLFSSDPVIRKRLGGGWYCTCLSLRGNFKSIWKESRSSVYGLGPVGC